jgi:hypothetical protein
VTKIVEPLRGQFVAFSETPRSRIEKHRFDRNLFFGQPDSDGPGPQAYVNDLDPGVELAAHFHKVDQYQVFFGEQGSTYKRRAISPVMLHYTDAYSTYGPFSSGPDTRLAYATLRARSSNYGGVMPGARDELIRRGGLRNLTVDVDLGAIPDAPRVDTRQVIGGYDDGLAATLVMLGPGASHRVPASLPTSGRYTCVLTGDLVVDGQHYEPRSLGWSDPGSTELHVSAGDEGCRLLVMDFPSPATPETFSRA